MALQFDLLTRGLSLEHLGSEAFTWYDLHTMVRHLQSEHTSHLAVEFHGPTWSMESQLLAIAADTLAMGNWQRAGKKSAPKPKRIQRPWEKVKATVLGSKPIPIAQFNDWWDSHKPKPRKRKRAERKKPPTA